MEHFEKAKCSQSKRMQVKVCNVCGSRGFSNALICCSRCSDTTVHQYCVGIAPGSLVDVYSWVCEYCSVVIEPESCTCHAFVSPSIEKPERCIVHARALTIKSKSEIMVIPNEPEHRLVLYPVTCKENLESARTRNCFRIDEDILSTSSISLGDSMDYLEALVEPISSFLEYPKCIMYKLVFLVCPSGEITARTSKYFFDEFNYKNAGDSAICGFLTYGEEPEVQVSSLMEYPEAISDEIVMLGKPAGEIIFYCGFCGVKSDDDSHISCWKATLPNMVNSSNDINSDKHVRKLGCYSFTPDSLSCDKFIDRNGDSINDCSMEEVVEPICVLIKETDGCSYDEAYAFPKTDMQGDTIFEYMLDDPVDVEACIEQSKDVSYVDGNNFKHRKTRKKKPISSFYDYLPPIRPKCKRARRKRQKILPSKGDVIKSLACSDHIPPLKPHCKSARSKRWDEHAMNIRSLSAVYYTSSWDEHAMSNRSAGSPIYVMVDSCAWNMRGFCIVDGPHDQDLEEEMTCQECMWFQHAPSLPTFVSVANESDVCSEKLFSPVALDEKDSWQNWHRKKY